MSNNEFDNIDSEPAKQPQRRNNDSEGGGLQTLIRIISAFPCFPQHVPKPDTPNIDDIKKVFDRFKGESSETDTSVVDRVDSNELCQWSEKIITYLPNVTDSKEAGTVSTVEHFKTIKRFYDAVKNMGFDPTPEIELFFNSIQIYEAVVSVAFVTLQEHPETMTAINEQLTKAVSEIEGHNTQGCAALLCGAAILSRFNTILGIVDRKLGELGVVKIAEFVANIIEVFCKFFNIDPKSFDNITAIADSIQEVVTKITSTLKSVFGDDIPKTERSKKWAPLALTERLKNKLSKFEQQAPIVQRTVTSFERFYNAMDKMDDNFETFAKAKSTEQRAAGGSEVPITSDSEANEDTRMVSAQPQLAAQILTTTEKNFEEVKTIGRLFQHLETIMSYGILLFKNEDEILNPLLDHVDECTKILDKFAVLHPLYKVLCGKNYLSKIKVIFKQIVDLLENSKLKLNSPKAFLKEFNKNYPNLLILICESVVNDKIKKKLDKLPDPLENLLDNALDGALSKFKNKFKF